MKISKIRFDESYKLRFYNKRKGLNQGNLDHEEFFDTKEEAVSRYKEVFDKNSYSLNPTVWVGDGDNWKRLSEAEINESLKEDFEDYEDRLFYRKSDRLENSVEKRFPGWKIFVEGSWQCGIGSDFIYIYPPDDIKLEDDPLSIYLDGSFLDISNREILKLIAQEIKPVIQANESLKEDFVPKYFYRVMKYLYNNDYEGCDEIELEELLMNSPQFHNMSEKTAEAYVEEYLTYYRDPKEFRKLKVDESLKEDDAVDDDNFLTEGFLHIVKE